MRRGPKQIDRRRARDWDTVIGLMKEQRIPGLNAEGQMTDAVLERISRLDHVTSLNLGGSTQLTDEVCGTWRGCRSCSSSI